jgi:hypothetical protein
MACFGGELVVSPSDSWEVFWAAIFTKHCTVITLTPERASFRITGDWDLLGGHSGGAGGRFAPFAHIRSASRWRHDGRCKGEKWTERLPIRLSGWRLRNEVTPTESKV